MTDPVNLIVVILALLAAATDVYTGKIPNLLTLPAALVGIAINAELSGWKGVLYSLEGFIFGLGLLMLFYLLGGMGAGDVKLLGAIGSLLGPYRVLNAFIVSVLIGGVMSLIYILYSRESLKGTVLHKGFLKFLGTPFCVTSKSENKSSLEAAPKISKSLPYGVPIAIGTILSLSIKW